MPKSQSGWASRAAHARDELTETTKRKKSAASLFPLTLPARGAKVHVAPMARKRPGAQSARA
jgi:hypothetical protein